MEPRRGDGNMKVVDDEASFNRTISNDTTSDGLSSTKEFYSVGSPLVKKRKSQYELNDPRSSSLKHKFRGRLTSQNNESMTTASLGCDGIFVDKSYNTDMVNRVEELESGGHTQSLIAGCIEVDSIKGVQKQSQSKMFWDQASTSSSSSNNLSYDAASSSFNTIGTKETDSLVLRRAEHDSSVQPNHSSINMKEPYNLLMAYDDLVTNELVYIGCSDTDINDEMLYSNGVDGFLLLPTGQSGGLSNMNADGPRAGAKKLTVDQEFEQYFSTLML